jgi:hypothetical protein
VCISVISRYLSINLDVKYPIIDRMLAIMGKPGDVMVPLSLDIIFKHNVKPYDINCTLARCLNDGKR